MNQAINEPSTHRPKLSIGMPVFNGEQFIGQALDSLLAQTFTNYELIISDNASTDNTENICREYASKDVRIRYVRQIENMGALANFQYVLDEAIGEYFMWAAVDDRRHPDFTAIAMNVLESDVEIGLVFCAMETVNLLTGELHYSVTGFSTTKLKLLRALFRFFHACPSLIYGLYRIDVLRQLRLKRYDYFDIYLSLWFELNSNIRVIPLVLYSAGTYGNRIPYSITGELVDPKAYFKETRDLLVEHVGELWATPLDILNRYLFAKTTRAHNLLIKSVKSIYSTSINEGQ